MALLLALLLLMGSAAAEDITIREIAKYGNLVLSMSRQLLLLIPLLLILPRFFGSTGLAACQAVSDLLSAVCIALPLCISIIKKINSLKDGDPPPFGKAGI